MYGVIICKYIYHYVSRSHHCNTFMYIHSSVYTSSIILSLTEGWTSLEEEEEEDIVSPSSRSHGLQFLTRWTMYFRVNLLFMCYALLCLLFSEVGGGHIVLRCSLFLDIHFMYMLVRDGTFFIFPLKLMIFGILFHRLRRRATYHHDPHLTLTFNIIVELFSFKFQVSLSGHVLQRFVRPFIEIVNHYCKR